MNTLPERRAARHPGIVSRSVKFEQYTTRPAAATRAMQQLINSLFMEALPARG